MRRKQIVICDSNEKYAQRLQDYITENRILPCRVEFYTEWNLFLDYINQNPSTVCVVSEDLFKMPDAKQVVGACTEFLFVLSEEEENDEGFVYRYQSADKLMGSICQRAGISRKGKADVNGGRMQLIGIYTPIRRCLQTSFALVLGQMLASRYRVLYLNFEAYSGFVEMMQKNFNTDMADLLYYLKNLSHDFSHQFEDMKQTINGLDYIPPAFSYIDISQILPGEWEKFLTAVSDCGEYDYVLLDLTDNIQGLYQILRSCAYVYTITRNDSIALAKIMHYENVLKELSFQDVLEKTKKCPIPIYRKLPIAAEDLLYSELADYTRKILKEDFGFQ